MYYVSAVRQIIQILTDVLALAAHLNEGVPRLLDVSIQTDLCCRHSLIISWPLSRPMPDFL